MAENIKQQTDKLPLSPGIYIFKDKNGVILYVGKAIRLRSRVRSYFARLRQGSGGQALSPNKQIMVKKIADIETIITSNESEALILESILIKKRQPPYNITLKDDKNYQFIKIDYRPTRPTVTTVRRPEHDAGRSQARYFGPYTSGYDLQESLRLLRRIFPYRKPARGWSASGRQDTMTAFEKDLLQKRALGPLPQSDEEYRLMINRLIRVLEGHSEEVMAELKHWMAQLSAAKQFEQAARVRDQIQGLHNLNSRQKIISVHGESQDVISLFRQDGVAAVNVFVIRAGKLIDKLNFILQHAAGESDTTVLDAFLTQYYSEATNIPKELILPNKTTLSAADILHLTTVNNQTPITNHQEITNRPINKSTNKLINSIPHHGKKRDLIKLGETNARDYLMRSLASWQQQKNEPALKELQNALKLDKMPQRIEGYDISNIQGNWSAGAMVVFTNREPDKKSYRKFKIRAVRGANDFASLAEVIKRRFAKTGWPQPDLVLLDGGKGQLSTVLDELFNRHPELACAPRARSGSSSGQNKKTDPDLRQDDGLTPSHFIALAKRAEEIFQGPNGQLVNIDPASSAGRLLQRIRDEAHRFGQAYYHSRHARANLKSQLDEIPGIGPATKKQLIKAFGSLAGIRQAQKNDIIKIIGEAKTAKLLENI